MEKTREFIRDKINHFRKAGHSVIIEFEHENPKKDKEFSFNTHVLTEKTPTNDILNYKMRELESTSYWHQKLPTHLNLYLIPPELSKACAKVARWTSVPKHIKEIEALKKYIVAHTKIKLPKMKLKKADQEFKDFTERLEKLRKKGQGIIITSEHANEEKNAKIQLHTNFTVCKPDEETAHIAWQARSEASEIARTALEAPTHTRFYILNPKDTKEMMRLKENEYKKIDYDNLDYNEIQELNAKRYSETQDGLKKLISHAIEEHTLELPSYSEEATPNSVNLWPDELPDPNEPYKLTEKANALLTMLYEGIEIGKRTGKPLVSLMISENYVGKNMWPLPQEHGFQVNLTDLGLNLEDKKAVALHLTKQIKKIYETRMSRDDIMIGVTPLFKMGKGKLVIPNPIKSREQLAKDFQPKLKLEHTQIGEDDVLKW